MAELINDCCAPAAQDTCCDSADKVSCCGEAHGSGCGCSAGSAQPPTTEATATAAQMRETVREKYAAAGRGHCVGGRVLRPGGPSRRIRRIAVRRNR